MSEASPSFQFYPRDFIADPKVAAMSKAEMGLYIQLLCYAWMDNGIPADLGELAKMVHERRSFVERAWEKVGPCFVLSADRKRFFQPRLERTRCNQSQRREAFSTRGKAGATRRWKTGESERQTDVSAMPQASVKHCETMLQALPEASPGDATSIDQAMLGDGFASASASATASAEIENLAPLDSPRASGEKKAGTEPARAAPSPARAFCRWFVQQGLSAGAIPADRAIDPEATVLRQNFDDAAALLATYGLPEVETRTRRFFAAVAGKKIRRSPTVSALRDAWAWDVVAGEAAAGGHRERPGWVLEGDGLWHRWEGEGRPPFGLCDSLPWGAKVAS